MCGCVTRTPCCVVSLPGHHVEYLFYQDTLLSGYVTMEQPVMCLCYQGTLLLACVARTPCYEVVLPGHPVMSLCYQDTLF